jgi:Peptide-N-glycosidase F, C terminal
MKKTLILLIILTPILLNSVEQTWNFNEPDSSIVLYKYGKRYEPQIKDGILSLVNGGILNNHKNVAIFPALDNNKYQDIELDWKMYITRGADGCGIAFLNTEIFNADSLNLDFENWQKPNIEGSFAIGFDICNPPTSAWFGPDGNYYDRPQREISLHWNGNEIKKILSPIEFRADQEEEEFKEFYLKTHQVIGGSEMTLKIKDEIVFDKFFIAEMQPYPIRLAVGGQTSDQTTTIILDDVSLKSENKAKIFEAPINVKAVDNQPIFIDYRETEHHIIFPEFKEQIGRIILTLEMTDMPGGFDPWDRGAAIYIWQDSTRYEICRFITPYNKGHIWKVDVTDFLPLFSGEKQIDLRVDTWQKKEENPEDQIGWYVSVDLDFYPGIPDRIPVKVLNLWTGSFKYGDPLDPMNKHLPQLKLEIPNEATDARIKLMVTGHGMHPNSQNAGEFMPADRTVYVNTEKFENKLWKTDCYLNSCRPQDGTWKFDRTGWAPGSIVDPWIIELKEIAVPGDTLKIDYVPMAYRNLSEGDHWKANHWFESQIIFYK